MNDESDRGLPNARVPRLQRVRLETGQQHRSTAFKTQRRREVRFRARCCSELCSNSAVNSCTTIQALADEREVIGSGNSCDDKKIGQAWQMTRASAGDGSILEGALSSPDTGHTQAALVLLWTQ